MGKISTLQRLVLPIAILVIIAALVLASLQSRQEIESIQQNAKVLAQTQLRLLTLTESLVGDKVKAGMRLLQRESALIGQPEIRGTTILNGEAIPNLYLGNIAQTKNLALVDKVTSIVGGTATIFVKSGDQFIRIATNIRQTHRARAIGTRLSPDGKAIKYLLAGKPFYGVVDILGNPYISGYEPMLDKNGDLIGIWYVGYEANIDALRQSVESSRFLESGFAAMLDENNSIRFLSSHISQAQARQLLEQKPNSWTFVEESMPSWGFRVVFAYPLHEAQQIGFIKGLYILFGGLIILVILTTLFVSQLKRLVIRPIGGDPAQAVSLVHAISAGNLQEDGLIARENTLMSDMLKMRGNLREMIATLKQNSERLSLAASVFDHTHDGIFITDEAIKIAEVNPAFESLTGLSRDEVIGKNPLQLQFAEFGRSQLSELIRSVNNYGTWHGEIRIKHNNGQVRIAELDVSTVMGETHKISHYVGVMSDITLMKIQQQSLEQMAYHDALTNLPNRTLFFDRLNQALAKAKRSNERFALCYLDLDGFKPINDVLGHDAGDELLVQLSRRMRDSLRMGDTIARMGGDEFALLLSDLKSDNEAHITLQRVLDCVKAPYLIKNQEVRVSASAGMIIGVKPDSTPETLLQQADRAMYHAKLGEGDTYYVAVDAASNS